MLLESSIRIVFLGALLLLPMRLARVKSAATWHAAYTVLLVAMLLTPVATAFLPTLPVHILPAQPVAVSPPPAEPAFIEPLPTPSLPAPPATDPVPPPVSPPRRGLPSWPDVAAFAYLAVALVLLLRFAVSLLRTCQLKRASSPGPSGALVSDRISVPVTVGLLRPAIILPASSKDWSPSKLAAALTHEWFHARRRDPLITALAAFNKCLFWFHPLAWWIERRLSALAEEAADDACLAHLGDRDRYAAILLEMARAVSSNRGRLAVAMARSANITRRIDRILTWKGTRPLTRSRVAALVAVAIPLGLAAAAFQAVPGQPPPPAPRQALASGSPITVEGKVVDSSTRQPVAGARVVYLRMDGRTAISGPLFDVEPKPADDQDPAAMEMAVLTDMGGNFHFHVNAPVEFQLRADSVGFVTSGQVRMEAAVSPDPVTIELVPESTISGRVVDADTGEPVAGIGVGVDMNLNLPPGLTPMMIKPATTDRDGLFRIEGLLPSDYRIQVAPRLGAQLDKRTDDPDFRDRENFNYGRYWYPGVGERSQAVIVTLGPGGAVEGIEIPIAKVRTVALRGRVFGGDEARAAGEVSISLNVIQHTRATGGFGVIARGLFAVGEGFRIDSLLPGTYWLIAQTRSDNPADMLRASRIVEVRDRNLDDVDLVLLKGVTITGRVRLKDTEDVPGQPALPADDIEVNLRPPLRAGVGGLGRGTVHPEDGSFVLESMMPDEYQVQIKKLPEGLKISEVRYNGSVAPHGVVTLNPEASVHRLEVTLAPAPGSLSVTVTDGTRAVSGATVLMVPEPADEAALDYALLQTRTDADGRAIVSSLFPGTYRAIAVTGYDWTIDPMLVYRLGEGQEVKVGPTAPTLIQIRTQRVR